MGHFLDNILIFFPIPWRTNIQIKFRNPGLSMNFFSSISNLIKLCLPNTNPFSTETNRDVAILHKSPVMSRNYLNPNDALPTNICIKISLFSELRVLFILKGLPLWRTCQFGRSSTKESEGCGRKRLAQSPNVNTEGAKPGLNRGYLRL